jgi:glucose-6-phosphate 1-epimerase
MQGAFTVAELDRKFGSAGLVRVCEGNGGLPRVQVNGAFGQGEMYLHGAHVTAWKPTGKDELLFVSTKSAWQEGQAIRGGIPICFPWFRAKVNDRKAPAHGIARTKIWELESIDEIETGVTVSMSTESDELTRQWWPAEFRLVHRVTFGSELNLELVCTNTGTTPFRFEEALHTYNRVGDVGRVRLRGLNNAHFLDKTDSNKEKTQLGDVAVSAQTDNAYLNTAGEVELLDDVNRRRIRLRKRNSLNTVVWNPWREGSAALGDLGDGEWSRFLCVEASNILDSAVSLEPGKEHRMTAVISVEQF